MTEKEFKAIVEGIFERIGFDLCHYPTISGLSEIVEKIIDQVKGIGDSIQLISEKTSDGKLEAGEVAELGQELMPRFKDLMALGKMVADTEFDRLCTDVARELYGAVNDAKKKIVSDYLSKSFVREIIDYLLMTLLRNAREVFQDHIDYVRLKRGLASSINDLAGEAANGFNSFKKELEDVLTGVKDAGARVQELLGDSLEEFRKVCERLGVDPGLDADDTSYEKVAKAFTSTYSIMEFLGLIHQKQVTLKLPKQMVNALISVSKKVTSASKEIQGATENVAQQAKTATVELTKAIQDEIGVTFDALNLSQGSIVTFSTQLGRLITSSAQTGQSMVGDGASAVNSALQELQNFSYPIRIPVIRWGKVKDLFTRPIDYFQELYPLENVEDVQELATRILDILHGINPDIPDFSSIMSLLESLIKKLQRLVLETGKEALKSIYEKVEPIIAVLRKVIDMLKEMGKALESQLGQVLTQLQENLKTIALQMQAALEGTAQEIVVGAQETAGEIARELSKISIPIPNNALFSAIYKDVLGPALEEFLSDSLNVPISNVEGVVNSINSTSESELQKWANATYTDIKNSLSPSVWEDRLSTLLYQLRAEFKSDAAALQGVVSAKGIAQLARTRGASLKDSLDINSYITIIKEAVQEVVLPDPELYFYSFTSTVRGVLKSAVEKVSGCAADVKSDLLNTLESKAEVFAASIWDRIKKKVIGKALSTLREVIVSEVRYLVRSLLSSILAGMQQASSGLQQTNGGSQQTNNDTQLPTYHELCGQKSVSTVAIQTGAGETIINISQEMRQWANGVVSAALAFASSPMAYGDILSLVLSLYRSIPGEVKDVVASILPPIPDFLQGLDTSGLTKIASALGCSANLDGRFCAVNVLNIYADKENPPRFMNPESGISLNLFFLLGSYNQDEQTQEDPIPALYCMVCLKGNLGATFPIGRQHEMGLTLEGGLGEILTKDSESDSISGIGLKLTPKNNVTKGYVHPIFDEKTIQGMVTLDFQRSSKEPWKVFDTEYLSLEIGNYPQYGYVGYGSGYSSALKPYVGAPTPGDPGLQAGYFGAIQGAVFSLHLSDVAFVKEVLKDDVKLEFDTYLWYDFQRGFDFGGDVSLHLDFDMNHKKLGPLTIDSFSVDAGTVPGESGKLQVAVGTTFQVNFADVLVVAIENLGVGLLINYKDDEGKFGDFDMDFSMQYPSGIGITVDATAVKGTGLISIDQETGEFFGILSLDILKKIAVKGYLLCDPGTAEGHFFSLIVLLSAEFSPGIPLGMGFSLNAIGGTIGLNRQISRDAVQNGVRAGTLGQVFFVKDVEDNLAEMKTNIVTYFPAKDGQFFFGLLGQIRFEPIVQCDFGLLLQLPSPTEIIIVGALRVDAAKGIVRINVYFAGGINFEEGMWFDASIVDSQIVGISISGDMAFRLNWGGTKGFLLSIGGFHPAYKPEEGLHVGKMNRLAMKLDYSILRLSFETYIAVTSNSFQIGARFDLKVGWDEFGIVGYAGFDALFQFNPFLFMFFVCAGVKVTCGGCDLLSIDLSLDVQGPAPWKIAGKAKFSALGIPVKVSFSKTWGKKTPELPSKLVAVIPIFEEEWNKKNNWVIDNSNSSGKALVDLFDAPKDVMIAQPDGSVTFNQSAIPMKTEELLEKMDMCNDAVPEDYSSLRIASVNALAVGQGSLKKEQNDFAPSLYKLMSIDEKLQSDSYVKYDSGFTLNERNSFQSDGNKTRLVRETNYEWKNQGDRRTERPGKVMVGGSIGLRTIRFSAGEEKLTSSVKKVKDLKLSKDLKVNINKPIDIGKPVNIDEPITVDHTFTIGEPITVNEPIRNPDVDVDKDPVDTRPLDENHVVIYRSAVRATRNNRRDRVAFDRYLAVLQKKAIKTNK